MNKKIMLLALAAVSAVVLALPAMASALVPLHLNPTPSGTQTIHGGPGSLSTGSSTVSCNGVSGGLTFESGGTTGTMNLKFGGGCTSSGFSCNSPGEASGNIATTALPFHLVTLANEKPGVLVTPNASGSFAHIECAFGLVKFTVTGNGVIGTIEQECGEISNRADIDFNAVGAGQQEHKTVLGTSTEYDLLKGAETAAQDTTGTVTFTQSTELDCT
jgi:hypothetical protein